MLSSFNSQPMLFTYNDARLNNNIILIFLPRSICRVFNNGSGRAKMTRSSKMLTPAPAYPTAVIFTHRPGVVRSHNEVRGQH